MSEFINGLIANLIFIFQRLNWLSVVDLILVTAVFFGILLLLRDTQAMVLLRGALLLVALISLLTSLEVLPAFSWLVRTTLPALLFVIPVIFAPEIRRALERLGRAGAILPADKTSPTAQDTITGVVTAATRLADRQHGALIVIQRRDVLDEYVRTGVYMDARVTPELLLQVFYPNTPLHDGAVIISGSRLVAASCVMPLSASGVLVRSPERQMGLRHRAALGISEVSDAVAVVWVSAVVTADPNEERTYTRPLTLVGQDSGLQLVGDIPQQVRITLRAPRSRLNQMTNNPSLIHAWIDLSGKVKGEQAVPVKVKWDLSPVRLLQAEPQEVEISLEPIVTENFAVQISIDGDPPLGYKKGEPVHEPAEVTVSGPESTVTKVAQIHAALNIGGANESVKSTVPLEAVDENGDPVAGVTITPRTVTVTQPITLQGGYKNVVVKVVTTGQVATGYRLTNLSVSPPNVTVFSTNPDLVNELPGYVETLPLDLTGLNDDIDIRMALNLPKDISLVGEQSVLVQVGVAAIEGSLTVSLPVETLGLPPDLQARISPATVDVIVSGPLPILDGLTTASFRAVVDVTGLAPGDYQLSPVVDLTPDQVHIQTVLPETVEVVIALAPTPAPATPTPASTAQP